MTTTPDPITTAREALDDLPLPDFETDKEMREYWQKIEAIRAALTELEKLKAERDEWEKRAISAISLVNKKDEQITRLTSQLEQAKQIVCGLDHWGLVIETAIRNDDPRNRTNGYHAAVLGLIKSASQWIRDRQAKGEG